MSGLPISILFLSTSLTGGGAQRFVSTLLHHLDRATVEPSLCLLRDEMGFPLPGDVPVATLGYQRLWDLPRAVEQLRRHIEQRAPQVLLSNIAATNLLCGLALARCQRRPIWIARIGNEPSGDDPPGRRILARRLYRRVDRFVVNSAGLAASFEHFYPIARGRIEVLLNPTDFDAIDRSAEEPASLTRDEGVPLLVAVGRLFPQKRYDLLLEAFALVRKRTACALWICGDGPLRESLETRVRRLGLSDSVKLLGFCANPFPLMRQADVFVMSSDHEGLPNALIEAQGLGVPAVSTRCPHGPEEIIEDGETGLLVPPGAAQPLADAILHLLSDHDLAHRMGACARRLARQRFAARPLTLRWQELLTRTVALGATS